MKATTFLRQTVTNPNTGEETERLAVQFDNAKVLRMYLRGRDLDEVITAIKADKEAHIKRVVVATGEFGDYAMFSGAVTTEEI